MSVRLTRRVAPLAALVAAVLAAPIAAPVAAQPSAAPARRPSDPGSRPLARPFGTLREQADRQQRWLAERMRTVLPALMRRHGVDMWVVPMREYNEDPVFSSLVSPTTFAARRRTIYLFFDRCAGRDSAAAARDTSCGIERLAFGGTSQGGVYEAVRAMKTVQAAEGVTVAAGSGSNTRQAELWGDEQWTVLRTAIEKRNPKRIAVDVSRTFAFSDGLSAG